jgi:heat-inducible transcriptional repressor
MTSSIQQTQPNNRAQHLLKLLIQKYISEGIPIGSRTLSKDSNLDLSPATIRHVMSDLETMGLISSPHTSAGRIPTSLGYRMFVDTLVRYKEPEEFDIEGIQSELIKKSDNTNQLVSKVSRILSRITSLAGVVSVPKKRQVTLRQIEFLPLSDNRILAILILNNSEVQNRIINTKDSYSIENLQRAANYINDNYASTELNKIREFLIHDLEKTRETMNRAMIDIISVAQSAMEGTNDKKDFVLAGEHNLMDFAELSNVETLKQLFDAFSKKQMMIDLLDRSINASGVQIFIGSESGYEIFDDCSIVTSPYKVDHHQIGVLGVIGPTRMEYDKVVPIVDLTAKLLSSALNHDS